MQIWSWSGYVHLFAFINDAVTTSGNTVSSSRWRRIRFGNRTQKNTWLGGVFESPSWRVTTKQSLCYSWSGEVRISWYFVSLWAEKQTSNETRTLKSENSVRKSPLHKIDSKNSQTIVIVFFLIKRKKILILQLKKLIVSRNFHLLFCRWTRVKPNENKPGFQ